MSVHPVLLVGPVQLRHFSQSRQSVQPSQLRQLTQSVQLAGTPLEGDRTAMHAATLFLGRTWHRHIRYRMPPNRHRDGPTGRCEERDARRGAVLAYGTAGCSTAPRPGHPAPYPCDGRERCPRRPSLPPCPCPDPAAGGTRSRRPPTRRGQTGRPSSWSARRPSRAVQNRVSPSTFCPSTRPYCAA